MTWWKRRLYTPLVAIKMGGAKPIMCSIELINHGIWVGNKMYDRTSEEDKLQYTR